MANEDRPEPIYCGSAKRQTFTGKNGDEISYTKLFVNLKDIPEEHIQDGRVGLEIWKRRNPKSDWTHSVKVDTWKPPRKGEGSSAPVDDGDGLSGLPF